jgi:hypothetical protein
MDTRRIQTSPHDPLPVPAGARHDFLPMPIIHARSKTRQGEQNGII